MYKLDNKVVMITGASNGIGASIVCELLKEGAKHVRILDIDEPSGISLQNELNQKYGDNKAKFTNCDVSNDEQLFKTFENVTQEFGYIDLLINNAGVLNETNYAAIRKEIEINLTAPVNGTFKVMELMRKDRGGRGGTVINVSSIGALIQKSPTLFVYMATKSAVLHFSNCIGKEPYYSITGVRVLTVCYGITNTAIVKNFKGFDEHMQNNLQYLMNLLPSQSAEAAAQQTIEVYKKGESGSTWLIHDEKPAQDITSSIDQAYDILNNLIKFDG